MSAELALAAAGCAILLYALGRHNRALVLARWEFVLHAPERQAIEALRQRLETDSALVRQAFATAEQMREERRTPDALTVLQTALAILEDAGVDRLTRLKAMGVYARMVQAIRPAPPPSPAAFRGAALRAAAAVSTLVHGFLVGTQERFRLWLVFLRFGVGVVLRGGRRSVAAAGRTPHRDAPWTAFRHGLDDFGALDEGHLAAFEALVASLAAVDRGGRLQLWERIAGDSS